MDLIVGQEIYIQSFKHDGSLHRTWATGLVIEVTSKYVVVVTDHTTVTEADGRKWRTREPAICYFYPDRWYNVICMIRKQGVFFYCNLASPYIYDKEALKNIDYDLDLKVLPNGSYKLLDEDEYNVHQKIMDYPQPIKDIIKETTENLIKDIKFHISPFNQLEIGRKYEVYLDLLAKLKK